MRALASLAVMAVVAVGCTARDVGTEVAVNVSHTVGTVFTTDSGYEVTLQQAAVTVSSFELERCASVGIPAWLFPIGTAHAHTPDSATRLGTGFARDLLVDGSAQAWGTLHPPAVRFCGATVTVGPADAHAQGNAAAVMNGKSLLIQAEIRPSGTNVPIPLNLESTGSFPVDVTFANSETLTLDSDHRTAAMALAISPARWFDGIDFATKDEAGRKTALEANLGQGIQVSIVP